MPRRPNASARVRCWMFTINNPVDSPDVLYSRMGDRCRYTVFQRERGAQGTEHYQGYVEFNVSLRLAAVKKLFPTAHWEPRRGSADQARTYCMKEDTREEGPWEFGNFKGSQGKRNDLDAVVATMKTAATFREVVQEHSNYHIRYAKGMRSTYAYLKSHNNQREPPRVYLLYGPTGTGKTRYVMSREDVFKKSGTDQWFDGYLDQQTLLIDDFAGARSKMPLSHVLQVLDRYAVQVPVKGDFANLVANRIFVTTNIHPRLWYDYSKREEHYKALARRFHKVYWFRETGKITLTNDSFWNDWAEGCDENQRFVQTPDTIEDTVEDTQVFSQSPEMPQLRRQDATVRNAIVIDDIDLVNKQYL